MEGRLEQDTLESPSLRGNPLGDPSRRPVYVYVPPGFRPGLPAVYFLHGFTGSAHSWVGFPGFGMTVPERLDRLVASGAVPPALGVFVDGWTSLGGSQWLNSASIGSYRDYVARDVAAWVESRFGALPAAAARAVVGKSSGGYGALVMGRHHPDVFAHVASHAGDAGFEYCYLPDFPRTAGALLGTDAGAWLEGLRRRARETKMRGGDHAPLNVLAMAAAYSPAPGAPGGLELPFDPETARLRPEAWERWLAHDPVRFVPASLDAFRRLRSVFVDCGTQDEFNLRWGTRMVVESLRAGGVDVVHEEFEDGHRDVNYRYERSLSFLLPRLARG
ncbi:MAG TPA: alpha/beta hydrolase-fold protein [Anaeromyxobacteraceae bacterium]|nr:alpha/beta hydrolase-fold protein [Anaeromyxobacteraceae bacterium]